MALNDYETSVERGQPVELYKFIYGDAPTSFYAYTSAEQPIDLGGETYFPLPAVSHDKIKATSKFTETELRIQIPRSAEIASLFQGYPPGRVVSLIIRQGHVPNSDDPGAWATGENFPVAWTGRVLEVLPDNMVHTFVCESSGVGLKRPGLRRNYQWPCPLVLYGARCAADKAAAKTTQVVQSIAGNKVTLPAGWMGTHVAGDYVGGLAEWTTPDGTEARTVLRVETDVTIVLAGPPIGLSATDSIDVFLGCPHTLDGCETLHNNIVNYGGQPWIPTRNPVNKNNHT